MGANGADWLEDGLVIDTLLVAVKTAEMLVGLRRAGVGPSRRIGIYCKPGPELEESFYERIEDVFSIL